MPYIPEEEALLYRRGVRVGIFFRVAVQPNPARLCLGANDFPIGIDISDPEGTIYKAGGVLQAIPDLDILINGESERVEFTLSGIPDDIAVITDIATNMPDVKGVETVIGMAPLDARYQAIAPVRRLWVGYADFWSLRQSEVAGMDETVRTFTLSCGSGDTARIRARAVTWTAAQQRQISSDDAFCDRTPRYNPGYEVIFPRF